jgi:hypothetical protein
MTSPSAPEGKARSGEAAQGPADLLIRPVRASDGTFIDDLAMAWFPPRDASRVG